MNNLNFDFMKFCIRTTLVIVLQLFCFPILGQNYDSKILILFPNETEIDAELKRDLVKWVKNCEDYNQDKDYINLNESIIKNSWCLILSQIKEDIKVNEESNNNKKNALENNFDFFLFPHHKNVI